MFVTKYLKIADFIISVNIKGPTERIIKTSFFAGWVMEFYKGFLIDEGLIKRPDFNIIIEERKSVGIIVQKNADNKENTYLLFYEEAGNKKIRTYDDIGVFQFQLILRKILQKLLVRKNGLIMHGSAVAIGESAIFFSGRSGSGKSTIKNILRESYKSLADDKVIIRKIKGLWRIFQTPFSERASWLGRNSKSYPLEIILIPRKSQKYHIDYIDDSNKKFEFLMKQFFTEKEDFNIQIKTIQKLASSNVKLGKIYFSLDEQKVIKLLKSYAYQIKK